ncbi:MAG: hypothetical protein JWR61_1357 [Ferruginibacter sp.]|nr:hypothetical protein [Ferruginibacter sp.]
MFVWHQTCQRVSDPLSETFCPGKLFRADLNKRCYAVVGCKLNFI